MKNMLTLEDLYGIKGKITTEIEMNQAQLQQVNQAILSELQKNDNVVPLTKGENNEKV